jgi:hypothetical protein
MIMPDVNAIYQSEFLRAEQLGGQVRHATVEAATVEVLGQGEQAQQKIVLKLVKVKQRLPLNKTNAQTLAATWGPMTDNWIGRQLDLRSEKVMFAGKMVDSIRVAAVPEARKAPPAAAPAAAPAPVPAAPLGDAAEPDEWPEELADDIPWSAT